MLHEINITEFYNQENAKDYCNSIANSGLQNIGQITWNNAKECNHTFVTEENKQTFIDYFAEFGAWEDLEDWPINELNALVIQELSHSIDERSMFDSWEEYEDSDQVSHNLFYHESENKYYFTLC